MKFFRYKNKLYNVATLIEIEPNEEKKKITLIFRGEGKTQIITDYMELQKILEFCEAKECYLPTV